MKIGSTYSGFLLVKEKKLEDISSIAKIFKHEKSGAQLVYLENEDDNKVFSITFKTPPYDNTGVSHIIEHSLLCGSRKYPTKDPFLELIKSSLKTFLNAITYPDKTIYPVASRNEKDFSNLMSVYLDAVFYPNIYTKPEIFSQEGWHYHLESEKKKLFLNGVVYSEMKGAYSSPERILYKDSLASLYSDTPYRFSSGGKPEEIPNLSYKKFIDFHKKYYHPSNSYIFLYGKLDIEEKLTFLDKEYLSNFKTQKLEITLNSQSSFKKMVRKVSSYSISKEEKDEGRTYFSLNYALGEVLDLEEWLSASILVNLLIQTKSAPLKKALLEAGIGEDVFGHLEDDVMLPYVSFVVKNSSSKEEARFLKIVKDTLSDLTKKGLNKDLLEACINTFEFSLREADFGSKPKGLFYNLTILKSWLYGKDPLEYLSYAESLDKIKERVKTDYFEKMIEKYFLKNNHTSLLVLKPEKGLAEKKEKDLEAKLRKYRSSIDDLNIKKIINETLSLKKYQNTPDSLKDIAKIPKLKIEDVSKKIEVIPTKEEKISDVLFLFNPLETKGVCYLDMVFDTKIVPFEKLYPLNILPLLLGRVSTKKYSYEELDIIIKKHTGGCFFRRKLYTLKDNDSVYMPKIIIGGKVINRNLSKLVEILTEIMFESKFDDKNHIKNIIKEARSRLEMRINSDGTEFSAIRLMSYFSEQGKYTEYVTGITYYHYLTNLLENFDKKWDQLKADLEYLQKMVFNKTNLVGNVVCDEKDCAKSKKILYESVSQLKTSNLQMQDYIFPAIRTINEGLLVQSSVQYIVQGYNFRKLGYKYNGKFLVLKNILNGEYLWEELRVKGGAYGGYSSFWNSGDSFFGSFRDPNLIETLKVYEGIPKFLKGFKSENMSKFVIGAIGRLDMPLTPSMKGDRALYLYFSGIKNGDLQKERDEVLATKVEDIRGFSDLIEGILSKKHYCVLGNELLLKRHKKLFGSLVPVFR